MNAVQKILSLVMYSGHAGKQVVSYVNKCETLVLMFNYRCMNDCRRLMLRWHIKR